MQFCQILLTRKNGIEVAGTVMLDDGKVLYSAESHHEGMMADVARRPVIADDEKVFPGDDPQRWFNNLPNMYNGTYMRARILSGGASEQKIVCGLIEEDEQWITAEELNAILQEAGPERWITKDGRRIEIGGSGPHAGKHIMIGVAPYRTQSAVASVDQVPAKFKDFKTQEFEKQISEIAKQFPGVQVAQVRESAGVWQSTREPSFMITGTATDQAALDAYAAKLGESAPERQQATVSFLEDQQGKGFAYQVLGVKNQEAAIGVLLKNGFEGATVPLGQGKIILFDENGSLRGNIKKASGELGLRYTKVRGHVHFIAENDYAKVQNAYAKSKAEAEEIYYRDDSSLPEDGDEIAGSLMDKETVMLMQIAEAAGGGMLHWITKDGRRIPLGGQQTTAQQFRSPSGKWRADRVANANQFAQSVVAGKMPPVGRKPIAYILGGGTGVGKTTVADQIIGKDLNAVDINADKSKIPITEYTYLKIVDPLNAAHLVHDESKMITEKVLAKTIARRLDFTYDSTTSGTGGPALIHELYKKGYDVRAVFVDIPVSMAIQRAALRTTDSTRPENLGRVVPEGVIRTTHQGSSSNFFEIKNSPELTSIQLYDNSVQHAPPTLVYSRTNDHGYLGQEKIYDQARYRKYSRKSVGLSEAAKKVRFIRPGHLPDTRGRGPFDEDGCGGGSGAGEGKGIAELILETEATLRSVESGLASLKPLLD